MSATSDERALAAAGCRQRSRVCTVGRAALLGSLILAGRRLSTSAHACRPACGFAKGASIPDKDAALTARQR